MIQYVQQIIYIDKYITTSVHQFRMFLMSNCLILILAAIHSHWSSVCLKGPNKMLSVTKFWPRVKLREEEDCWPLP